MLSPILGPDGSPDRILCISRDITARRCAEGELRASEERYRALLEASTAIFWRADPSGSVLEGWGWNEYSGQFLDQYKGEGWLAAVHPDDVLWLAQRWCTIVESEAPEPMEYRARTAEGEYRWVRARAAPLRDADGSIREWVGTLTDIHDRKQAETALRQSEQRLRMALGAARMVAWELDTDENLVTRSVNSHELLGLGSGPLSEYLERVHPEDRARVEAAALEASSGKMVPVEFRFIQPDGEMMWLEVRAVQLNDGLTPKRLVGVTFDITERKQIEEGAWRAANHDALTGLPNRAFFQKRLKHALLQARTMRRERQPAFDGPRQLQGRERYARP